MRRQTGLKVVPREETGQNVTSGSYETKPATTTERGILATLGEMERTIEEAFNRPFFGFNTLPMRQLLHGFGAFGEYSPSIDIFDDKKDIVVKAEIPGIKREDIKVDFVGNSIVISGEKKAEETVDRKGFYRVERAYGSFNRSLVLPEGIDQNKAKATFKDGVLEVRIPKNPEKSNVRHVAVE